MINHETQRKIDKIFLPLRMYGLFFSLLMSHGSFREMKAFSFLIGHMSGLPHPGLVYLGLAENFGVFLCIESCRESVLRDGHVFQKLVNLLLIRRAFGHFSSRYLVLLMSLTFSGTIW